MEELKEVKVKLKLEDGDSLLYPYSISTPDDAVNVMKDYLSDLDRENLVVVNLDTQNRPLNFNVVSVGTINESLASMSNLFKSSILQNAAKVMIFHNHPSGSPAPSEADRQMTARAMSTGKLLGIDVLDHIIIAPRSNQYYSFSRNNEVSFSHPERLYNIQDELNNRTVIAEEAPKNTYSVEIEEIISRAVAYNELTDEVQNYIDDAVLDSDDYVETYIHELDEDGVPVTETQIFGSNGREYYIDTENLDMLQDKVKVTDIEEVLAITVEITAASAEDAVIEARRRYRNSEIVLDSSSFIERTQNEEYDIPDVLKKRIKEFIGEQVLYKGKIYQWKKDAENLESISERDVGYGDGTEADLIERTPEMKSVLEDIEGLGWTVQSVRGNVFDGFEVMFENYSDGGEDLVEYIRFDGTSSDFLKEWTFTAENFNPDEHADMWYRARLERPDVAPDLGLRGFLEDADSIQAMYYDVVSTCENAIEKYHEEEHEYSLIDNIKCELDDKWVMRTDGMTAIHKVGHPVYPDEDITYISSSRMVLYNEEIDEFVLLEKENQYDSQPTRFRLEQDFKEYCKAEGYKLEPTKTVDEKVLDESVSYKSSGLDIVSERLSEVAEQLPDNTYFRKYNEDHRLKGEYWYYFDRTDGTREIVVIDAGYGLGRYFSETFADDEIEAAIEWIKESSESKVITEEQVEAPTTDEVSQSNEVEIPDGDIPTETDKVLNEYAVQLPDNTDFEEYYDQHTPDGLFWFFSDNAAGTREIVVVDSGYDEDKYFMESYSESKVITEEQESVAEDVADAKKNDLLTLPQIETAYGLATRMNRFLRAVNTYEYHDRVGTSDDEMYAAITEDSTVLESGDREKIQTMIDVIAEYVEDESEEEYRQSGEDLLRDLKQYLSDLQIEANETEEQKKVSESFIVISRFDTQDVEPNKRYTVDEFNQFTAAAKADYEEERSNILSRYNNDIEEVQANGNAYESYIVTEPPVLQYDVHLSDDTVYSTSQRIIDSTDVIQYLDRNITTRSAARYLMAERKNNELPQHYLIDENIKKAIDQRVYLLETARVFWNRYKNDDLKAEVEGTLIGSGKISKEVEDQYHEISQNCNLVLQSMLSIPSSNITVHDKNGEPQSAVKVSEDALQKIWDEKDRYQKRVNTVRVSIRELADKQYSFLQQLEKQKDQKEIERLTVQEHNLQNQVNALTKIYELSENLNEITKQVSNAIDDDSYRYNSQALAKVFYGRTLHEFAAEMTGKRAELNNSLLSAFGELNTDDYISMFNKKVDELVKSGEVKVEDLSSTTSSIQESGTSSYLAATRVSKGVSKDDKGYSL